MAITSGLASYASNADVLAYYDARLVADLIGDSGARLDPSTVLTHPTLTKLVKAASGRLEASALAGGRYTATRLAALTSGSYNAGEYIKQLIADLAIGPLLWRRDPTSKHAEVLKRAEEALAELRGGALIFGEQEVVDAAQPESVPQLGDATGQPRVPTSIAAGRYFGDRGRSISFNGGGGGGTTTGSDGGGAGTSSTAANTIWAGPAAGPGGGNPAFRTLVAADLPSPLAMEGAAVGSVIVSVRNTNTGTNTFAAFQAQGDSSNLFGQYGVTNSTHTALGGLFSASTAFVRAGVQATGGLALFTQAAAPIRFGTGGFADANERARIDATGLHVLGSLEVVASGGTVLLTATDAGGLKLGFFGASAVARPTVTGTVSVGPVASLIACLVALGLITDGTTPI